MPDRDPDPAAVEALAQAFSGRDDKQWKLAAPDVKDFHRMVARRGLAVLDAGRVPGYRKQVDGRVWLGEVLYEVEGGEVLDLDTGRWRGVTLRPVSAPVPGDPA